MAYSRDTEVELKGTFKDDTDALTSPTEVTLYVRSPSGTVTTYTLGGGEVLEESEGIFTRAVVLDVTGTWYYRFKGTGAVKVADWKSITVVDDPFNAN